MLNKPIKEWTVAEVMEYCRLKECANCRFFNGKCEFKAQPPEDWKLPKHYSKEAIKAAKHIQALFPEYTTLHIERRDYGERIVKVGIMLGTKLLMELPARSKCYELLKELDNVSLSEIIHEGEETND